MGEWFGCSGKRKDWRHTFYFVWNDLKKWGSSCCWWRGAFSCIIFSRHQMEDSADKHEGMCRSLSHRVFPPKFFFYLYIFHQRDGDLGTGPISWLLCKCDRASCERKEKEAFLQQEWVGVGGLVCVATTFAVQLLTEWVSDAMSLLLIVPPDELILYLLSSRRLFTLIRFVLLLCPFLTKFHLCRSSSEVRGGVSMSGSSDVTPLATVEPFVVRY